MAPEALPQNDLRSRPEPAADAAAERARIVVETTASAVITVTPEGTISGWDGAAAPMFGLPASAALGRAFRTVLDVDPVAASGTTSVVHALREGGRHFPAEVTIAASREPGAPFYLAVVRDASDRYAFERTIQETLATFAEEKGRLEAILAATSDGMVLLGPSGRVLYANRSFLTLFGLSPALVTGARAPDLVRRLNERAPTPENAFARLLGTEDVGDGSLPPLRCEVERPSARSLQLETTLVSSRDGVSLGRLAVFRDVSAEEEARRTKENLIANLSHDFKTPLTSIRGFVDLLSRGRVGPLNERQAEFVSIVGENVERLTELVSDLVDVDRLETATLASAPVNLSILLREVAAAEEVSAARKGLTVQLDVPDGLTVPGDAGRLRQVFSNLLRNAVKYTRKGHIRVRARPDGSDRAAIEVEDTGVGIRKEDLPRVFERFFRTREAHGMEVGGTGIGLAIVHKLVTRHEGTIEVESQPEQGSRFRVRLPRLRDGADPAERSGFFELSTGRIDEMIPADLKPRQRRVLIVDRDPVVRKVCEVALRAEDVLIFTAAAAGEVEGRLSESPPDLVILGDTDDAQAADGLARTLQGRSDPGPCPVIQLTGAGRHKAESPSFAGWVRRPIDPDALRTEVERLIGSGAKSEEVGGPRA